MSPVVFCGEVLRSTQAKLKFPLPRWQSCDTILPIIIVIVVLLLSIIIIITIITIIIIIIIKLSLSLSLSSSLLLKILCIVLLTLDLDFRYMDFVVSCEYFTSNGHSVTCCFLWQGAFYAQVASGNAYNLNPLVFQKLTFLFPTFPVSPTVTDVRVDSSYSPIHFIVFAWGLFDCITVQCLNITSNGMFLPCYGRT